MTVPSRTRSARLVAGVALAATLAGCATYRAAPLADGGAVLAEPIQAELAKLAAALDHPRLKPLAIDFSRPLTPDELAVIAVVSNPDLKAARTKAQLAEAQVFSAGLLPDPQVNLTYDKLLSGPDSFDAVGGALVYELNALRTRGVTLAGERASQRQVRYDLAWQEWQTAGQAKLLAARIGALQAIMALDERSRDATQSILDKVLKAAARGDVKADEVESRRIAAADAADKARQAERDLSAARLDLNKLLGLTPQTPLLIASPAQPSTDGFDAAALFAQAQAQRLDLAALRAGYDSQEAGVRKAVMDQFPSLQLTVTRARDTSDNQTIGPAVNFTLPLWNRGRGGIAVAEATRAQLHAEYAARLFATRADIAALVDQLRLELRQRDEVARQAGPLRQVALATEDAARRGDLPQASADTARQALTDKELAVATLDQTMAEQRVTLELAVGALLPEQTR